VRNNIAYGDRRNASEAEILAATDAAYATDFIKQLPNGLDTVIGDNGVLLSGGQRQRLSIARAILANSPLLILDEATSALDTESERHIQAALERLLANRTTFMIAHRLSTIEKADKILVMQEGRIVEQGTHQELLAKQGAYSRLHSLQFKEEELLAQG
jgi:subfamily B ATP-binding cassette protein MsbA